MSLYNLASGELKKENNKLKQEIDKLVDANEDINREFSQYKYESKKEIERLNNIINELEKTLLEWHEYWEDDDSYSWQYKNAYDYLQELKGEDKE